MFNSLILTALAATQAATATYLPVPKVVQYTDTFDNLPPGLVASLQTPGIVNGIDYSSFTLAALDALSGAQPPSPPNVIAAALSSTLLSSGLSLSPSGTAKVAPGTKAFNLEQFYFACNIAQGASEVAVAEGCSIAVTGYNTLGQMVGEAAFAYTPANIEGPPFVKAILPPTFVDLVNVTFGIADAAVATPLTVLALDNITHLNFY